MNTLKQTKLSSTILLSTDLEDTVLSDSIKPVKSSAIYSELSGLSVQIGNIDEVLTRIIGG